MDGVKQKIVFLLFLGSFVDHGKAHLFGRNPKLHFNYASKVNFPHHRSCTLGILDSSYGSFFFPDLIGFIWGVVVFGCSVFFFDLFFNFHGSAWLEVTDFHITHSMVKHQGSQEWNWQIGKFSIDIVQWTMYFFLQRWPVSQGFLVSRYLRFCAKWKATLAVTCRWSTCWCWSWCSCCCCCCCRLVSEFLFKECVCWQL